MRNKQNAWAKLFFSLILLALFTSAGATNYNTNLVASPSGGESCGPQMSSFGWTGGDVGSWYTYSALAGVSPRTGNCLMGYYNSNNMSIPKSLYQDISIADLATAIDGGQVIGKFTGYFLMSAPNGGFTTVQFSELDASGNVIRDFASKTTSTISKSWTAFSYNQALESGTRKLRISLSGNNLGGSGDRNNGGFVAFDDFNLQVVTSAEAAPTISTIAGQSAISGNLLGPISFTYADADDAASALTITATSDNQTILPNARISVTGNNGNGSISLTPVAGQTGTVNVTIGVSDGIKISYRTFAVTVNPDYPLGSNLVTNGTGATLAGWSGETSRFFFNPFKVATLPSGSGQTLVTQELNIGKFSALVDASFSTYTTLHSGSGVCTFQALDVSHTVISSLSASGTLPVGTRYVLVTIGGPVGATIGNVNFTLTSAGYPKMTTIADQSLLAGASTASLPFVVAYTGASAVMSVTTSNAALIPSTNVVFSGTGYSRSLVVTSLANTTGVATITVLVNGTAVKTFRVTVQSVPGVPTSATAVAGNASATISFTIPASDGGSAITGYTVTSSPGSFTGTGKSSPITVTGLTNGTPYTFTVKATNTNGTGTASVVSNAVIPAAPPGVPQNVTATAGDASATVNFLAPVSNGGSEIQHYTVTSNPGSFTKTGTTSPITVTGLTNGTSYTFTVTASNAIGTGTASGVSTAVIPATLPGVPTSATAVAGNASATVSFTIPTSDGGSEITGYTVTSSPGSFTKTGTSSPITVEGLTNGTSYTFTVTATNGIGVGAASMASSAVTPAALPGIPQSVTATAGDASATVNFLAPVSNGGSEIKNYTVTSNPGSFTKTGTTSPITVTGLTNGTSYTFTVTATNGIGVGEASLASGAVIPLPLLPVANAIASTVDYNSTSNLIAVKLSGGVATSIQIVDAALHGQATMSGDVIQYSPTVGYAGNDTLTYTATNLAGTSLKANVIILVQAPEILYTSATSASAKVSSSFDYTSAVSGGSAPYAFAIQSGTLPLGLALNATTGAISGIVQEAGTFNVVIRASDASTGASAPFFADLSLSISVEKADVAIVLTSDSTTIHNGNQVILTAALGTDVSGIITFHEGTNKLGDVSMGSTGSASLALSTLARGIHSIQATFAGNSNYMSSISTALILTVLNNEPVITHVATATIAQDAFFVPTLSDVEATDADGDVLDLVLGAGNFYTLNGDTITPESGFSGVLSVPVHITDGFDNSLVDTLKITVTANETPTVIRSVAGPSLRGSLLNAAPGSLLKVSDFQGRQVFHTVLTTQSFDLSALPAGAYVVQVRMGSQSKNMVWDHRSVK